MNQNDPMTPTTLSPAAQAVWCAYEQVLENECVLTETDRKALAAALRVVADQMASTDDYGHQFINAFDVQDIADELEGSN
jgi:hypothetical protein